MEHIPKHSINKKKLFDPNAVPKKENIVQMAVATKKNDPIDPKTILHQKLKETYQFIGKKEAQKLLSIQERLELVEKYDYIIKTDFKLSQKYDLDTRKWRTCVYSLIIQQRQNNLSTQEIEEAPKFIGEMIKNYTEMSSFLLQKRPSKPIWAPNLNHIADLHRYNALYFQKESSFKMWQLAIKYYSEYANLLPSNGHAWSQLASVAQTRGFYLDALMNYMRSLSVSKPFLTSKETILHVFEVASKRVFETTDTGEKSKILSNESIGYCSTQRSLILDINSIENLISVDDFQNFLTEFTISLQKCYTFIEELDIVQQCQWWYTIGIITICNSHLVNINSYFDEIAKKVLLQKSIDLTIILLAFAFSKGKNSALLVFIQMILGWLCRLDIGLFFEKFGLCVVSWCESFSPNYLQVEEEKYLEKVYESTPCAEDLLLRGFEPLLIESDRMKSIAGVDVIDVVNVVGFRFGESEDRNRRIELLLGVLIKAYKKRLETHKSDSEDEFIPTDNSEGAVAEYEDRDTNQKNILTSANVTPRKTEFNFEEFDDFGSPGVPSENQSQESIEDTEITDLKNLKSNLTQRIKNQVDKSNISSDKTTLVFDTNLFLNCYKQVIALIESKRWKVCIPLAVVSELNGLGGSGRTDAKLCLDYIEKNMNTGKFAVMTYKASVLKNLEYKFEDWRGEFTNVDDVILSVAERLQYSCLVTNDINLRLKARNNGVFVIDSIRDLKDSKF